jgi:beta-mannanase
MMIITLLSVISAGSLLLSSIALVIPVTAVRTAGLNVRYENNSYPVQASMQNNSTRIYQNVSALSVKVGPPSKGVYLSALTDFGGAEDKVTSQKVIDYEKLIGKKIVWAYFSNNWGSGIKFPENAVRAIHSVGVIPFIRMMPRTVFTDGVVDPVYTLQGFIDGKFDTDLKKWAQDEKRVGIPIMVEFGTEVNGGWFPWSGILNGGAKTNGYGDPNFPDGPERFRDAYRHIIDLFRKEGVKNITWCFHVYPPQGTGDVKELHQPWNNMINYYPGDDYIDWIGISVYGAFDRGTTWDSFTRVLDGAYPELSTISLKKPLAVFEFGVLEDPSQGNKTAWIQDALQSIQSGRYPRIKAISYWNEKWNDCTIVCLPGLNGEINLKLDSSPKTVEVFRKIVASPLFVTQPNYFYN